MTASFMLTCTVTVVGTRSLACQVLDVSNVPGTWTCLLRSCTLVLVIVLRGCTCEHRVVSDRAIALLFLIILTLRELCKFK